MKPTKDRIFVDSNVLIYLLSDDEKKKSIVKHIVKENPSISVQVVSENVNVLLKKFKELTWDDIVAHTKMLMIFCTVNPMDTSTLENTILIKSKYRYQWYDSMILSSALADKCTVIYSEDMQHGQVIENTLTIINPFL